MTSLMIIKPILSTTRYFDDLLLLTILISKEWSTELQLNIANTSDIEALHLAISNGFVSSKIYDKRDDSDFDIVNFPFLDCDVPRRTSYGVYKIF